MLSDEFVDMDSLSLANAIGAVHGLEVVLWVPVDVIDDDAICGNKVDAQPSCPCGE